MVESQWVINPHFLEVFLLFRATNPTLLQSQAVRQQFNDICISHNGRGAEPFLIDNPQGFEGYEAVLGWWNKPWTWCEANPSLQSWRYYWTLFVVAVFNPPADIAEDWDRFAQTAFGQVQLYLSNIIMQYQRVRKENHPTQHITVVEQERFSRHDTLIPPWSDFSLFDLWDEGAQSEWNDNLGWNESMVHYTFEGMENPNYDWADARRSSTWNSFLAKVNFPFGKQRFDNYYRYLLDTIHVQPSSIKTLNYPGG